MELLHHASPSRFYHFLNETLVFRKVPDPCETLDGFLNVIPNTKSQSLGANQKTRDNPKKPFLAAFWANPKKPFLDCSLFPWSHPKKHTNLDPEIRTDIVSSD